MKVYSDFAWSQSPTDDIYDRQCTSGGVHDLIGDSGYPRSIGCREATYPVGCGSALLPGWVCADSSWGSSPGTSTLQWSQSRVVPFRPWPDNWRRWQSATPGSPKPHHREKLLTGAFVL